MRGGRADGGSRELAWRAVGEEEWGDLLLPALPPGDVELDMVSYPGDQKEHM